jgi:cbb3-type cytochrome oxidase subunit 3
MNPLIEQAREAIGLGGMAVVMTLLFMIAYFGWIWYAYNPANKQKWEEAAMLPFEDGGNR